MSKSRIRKKTSSSSSKITVYGILQLKTKKLIKVDLDEDSIWFEYDISMYSEDEYAVIKLYISL